jgi:16S rRNA (guanine1207-N2)-methyltransferase
MIDLAAQWIQQQVFESDTNENQLWLMDENHLNTVAANQTDRKIQVISNRWDVAEEAKQNGFNAEFSDFDLSQIADNSLDAIFYRISKEKPLVHHLFNQAWRCLKPGGQIYLAGYKNEGIKTYVEKLAKIFCDSQKAIKEGALYTAQLTKQSIYSKADCLDDQDYSNLRLMLDNNSQEFFSKPGLFGWNKVDLGSELLVNHLDKLPLTEIAPHNCLDLGCGYGYITLAASKNRHCHSIKSWTMTDNNAAAIIAAEKNIMAAGLNGKVIPDNCAISINETFDLILCNPPFHQGFNPDADLTEKFLRETKRLLSKKGIAFFVINQFVPLETKAEKYFSRIQLLHKEAGFKLISLQK